MLGRQLTRLCLRIKNDQVSYVNENIVEHTHRILLHMRDAHLLEVHFANKQKVIRWLQRTTACLPWLGKDNYLERMGVF